MAEQSRPAGFSAGPAHSAAEVPPGVPRTLPGAAGTLGSGTSGAVPESWTTPLRKTGPGKPKPRIPAGATPTKPPLQPHIVTLFGRREELIDPGCPTSLTVPRLDEPAPPRQSGPLPTKRARRRYGIILSALAALAALIIYLSLAWDNPMPVGSAGFWLIAKLRLTNIVVIVLVAFCHGLATVAFQTVTNNRILTPSIMGFESLYRLVQTAAVWAFGAAGVSLLTGTWQFVLQGALMVVFAVILYSWLLTGRRGDLQTTLLIGLILGGGLGAAATFIQRLLTPSDFDILLARLIGSIANSQPEYLPVAIPVAAVAGGLLWLNSNRLNVLSLGADAASNLGVHYKRHLIVTLILVSALVAVSTALVGPLTFFGFLIAMLSYQLADSYDHKLIFPIAWLSGIVVLGGAHFVLKHIFYAQGSVGIIIELVGGTFFLAYILKRGRL